MYNLITGDKDNRKHQYLLETTNELRAIILRHHSLYNVQASIFQNNFDENDYDDIVTALTIGDELSIPISYEEAKILFFALNVNMNNYESRIRSISKAYIFFNDFEGDYSKVTFIDTKSSIVHNAKIFYHEVVPGISVQYKIPFYVVNNNRGYHFTIAECDKYLMLINDEAYNITRKSMNKVLDGNYAKSFRNHEEVMSSLNTNIEVLQECLTDAEFTKQNIGFPFQNSSCLDFNANDKELLAWDDPIEDVEDWENKGKKYRLNKHYENIVALLPKGSSMTIFTV